jgi:hypothetical protein
VLTALSNGSLARQARDRAGRCLTALSDCSLQRLSRATGAGEGRPLLEVQPQAPRANAHADADAAGDADNGNRLRRGGGGGGGGGPDALALAVR